MRYVIMLMCTASVLMSCSQIEDKIVETPLDISSLVDFSMAGVNFSNSGIPDLDVPIFSVVDYGAIPNDTKEDRDAIQSTINAAEKAGGGIVFFPTGAFLINEQANRKIGLRISHSKIVLRGSGNSDSGTKLIMNKPLAPATPGKLWTVPAMITFLPENTPLPTSNREDRHYVSHTLITEDAQFGSISISVADSTSFKAGDVIKFEMENTAANNEFLQGKSPRRIWTRLIDKGVMVAETHEVQKVAGDQLFFTQPILTNIKADYGWKVGVVNSVKNVGIENLHFVGNFTQDFEHHKNSVHDSGFTAIQLVRTRHSWARNLRFTNVSNAVTVKGGVANSVLLNVIDGNRGHSSFSVNFGTRNLIGLNIDKTNKGQWHGPGASHLSVGNVIWKFVSPTSRGIDSHSVFPRHTLFDRVTSYGFGGWGGNSTTLPNHLSGLVFWNFVQLGEKVDENYTGKLDFWQLPESDDEKYGFLTAVNPTFVGYEGVIKEVEDSSFHQVVSLGRNVKPDSLFEYQLSQRLGMQPVWVQQLLEQWTELRRVNIAQLK